MNEAVIAQEVERAETELGIKREEVFLASKIPPKEQGYEKTKAVVEKSIKTLGGKSGYIDLMLLTFPSTPGLGPKDEKNIENRHDSWRALEEFVVSGTVKSIGVANFKPRHLEKLLTIARIKPVVNQFEVHPLYAELDTIALCKEEDILVEAYSPLAQYNVKLIQNETLKAIASKHDLDVTQIVLAYLLSQGYVVLPRSSK